MTDMTVMSVAFAMNAMIPAPHTCLGRNSSPPLAWGPLPPGARSVTVLCHDPDAPVGDWSHWVLINLPPDTRELPEGVPAKPALGNGAIQGLNDFGRHGYGGPCPPPGHEHRYFFQVFALDTMLDLDPKCSKADVLRAMDGHILAQGELVGTFKR